MGRLLQTKEDTGTLSDIAEEVKSTVQGVKENISTMLRDHKELTSRIDAMEKKYGKGNMPADIQEKFDKLSYDIATRMDAHDMFLQRTRFRSDDHGIDLSSESKEEQSFFTSALSVKNTAETPVTVKMVKAAVEQGNYSGYKEALNHYLRYADKEKMFHGFETAEQQKEMMVGADPLGGYLVTPQMSAKIVQRLFEIDPLRQLAATETITTGVWEALVDIDRAGYGWEGETETGAETTTPQWRKKRIPTHVMYGKPRASQTNIEDAAINVENWLAGKLGTRFAEVEGEAFVNGDGVGKPRGFITYPNGTDWGQVQQQVVGTVAGAIDCDGLIDVKYSLKETFLNRGTWLMRRTTVAEVMQLKDGMGRYIWKPELIGGDNLNSYLLGLSVRMSPTMPAIVAGGLCFALADWTEAYQIIDRLGITVQRDPYTCKPMVEFYTRKRVGGDVLAFDAIVLGRVNP